MNLIVWDIDDVLNDLMRVWFEQHWLPHHPECHFQFAQIRENPPHRVLGICEAEYLASLDEFRTSETARAMRPNPVIQEWFETRAARYRHVALTARPLAATPAAAEWLFRHFGAYVRTMGVVPSRLEPDLPAYDRTKGKFLDWLGKTGVLVDDNETNVKAAVMAGVQGVVFPQPWNQSRLSIVETLQLVEATAKRQRPVNRRPEPMEYYDEAF